MKRAESCRARPCLESEVRRSCRRARRLRSRVRHARPTASPSVVLIGGEAGVGKTRLASVVADDVVARGGRVMTGNCLELVERALPYGPVVQVLRQAARTMPPAEFDAVVGSARGRARAPRSRARHGVPPSRSATASNTTKAACSSICSVSFERLGAEVPLLFVIEDLHWADRSTRDLIVFLARNLRDTQVMLVGTYRSDDLHRRHPLRGGARRARPRRHRDAHRSGALHPRRGARSAHRHPRFAPDAWISSTRSTNDRKAIRSSPRRFVAATRDGDCRALPSTLRDLLLARVDELPASTRDILRTAAVIGRRFPHTLARRGVRPPRRRPARRPAARGGAPGARRPRATTIRSVTRSCRRPCTTTSCPASGRACTRGSPTCSCSSPSCSTAAKRSG